MSLVGITSILPVKRFVRSWMRSGSVLRARTLRRLRPPHQLRQLGDVRRDAPRLRRDLKPAVGSLACRSTKGKLRNERLGLKLFGQSGEIGKQCAFCNTYTGQRCLNSILRFVGYSKSNAPSLIVINGGEISRVGVNCKRSLLDKDTKIHLPCTGSDRPLGTFLRLLPIDLIVRFKSNLGEFGDQRVVRCKYASLSYHLIVHFVRQYSPKTAIAVGRLRISLHGKVQRNERTKCPI
jgi:hypothetical protein